MSDRQRKSRARINIDHPYIADNGERYSNLFHDLRYVLSKRGVQTYLVQHAKYLKAYVHTVRWPPTEYHAPSLTPVRSLPTVLPAIHVRYLDLLSLFQGMDEQRREVTAHVEYESNRWVRSFQLTIQLTRTIPMIAACYLTRERETVVLPAPAAPAPGDSQPIGRLDETCTLS